MAMKLSTGKVAFPIEFDNGDKDIIYFNPNDPDLGVRLIASKEKIQNRIDQMQFDDVELNYDGEALSFDKSIKSEELSDEQMEAIMQVAKKAANIVEDTKQIVMEEVNRAFGSDISSVVFKHCSPFARVNGEFFITHFLSVITSEIQNKIDNTDIKSDKAMMKHLGKYLK